MSKILELREKRAKAWDAAKAFLDTKRGDDGLLSAEDAASYEKMEADVVALGREVERLERQTALDAELAKATSSPITNAPQNQPEEKSGRASADYRREFLGALRGRAVVQNVLTTGVDADGGFLVPVEFEQQLIIALSEANVIRSIAKVIETTAPRKITLAESGSTANWVGESVSIPDSTPQFGQKVLDAFKLTDLVKVSTELLQDSMFDLEGYLIAEFARALGAAEEEAFCVGTGAGRPSGLFTATGGAQVGVTASGTAITLDNVLDLIYSLKSPYRRNAAFLMNDTTVAAIRKLKDANGQFLWQPSVQAGQPDRLLGYPLYTTPYAPAVAASSIPVAFGDFSSYWIADRLEKSVQRLNELYAGVGQIGFLATERLDGKVVVSEGIKLLQFGTPAP